MTASSPFKGEAGWGMGLLMEGAGRILGFQPHPPPALPLEEGGIVLHTDQGRPNRLEYSIGLL